MNVNDMYEMFLDAIPFQRKSSMSWLLPASIGLGVGAALGVGLGMVLAPQSGNETRRQLREGAADLTERARMVAVHAKEQVTEKANGVAEQLGYGSDHHAGTNHS